MICRDAVALVADDHALFRAALAEMMRTQFGFRLILEAGSLDEALGQLGSVPNVSFACVDLAMPGMAGAPSLRGLRHNHPGLPLAVVTASERREDILLALEAGVNGYVPKTLPTAAFGAALLTILEGGIFVPPVLANGALRPWANPGHELADAGDAGLSPRQQDVMRLIALGKSNKEIARTLNLAAGTVKAHVNAIFRAVGASNRVTAITAMARRGGIGRDA